MRSTVAAVRSLAVCRVPSPLGVLELVSDGAAVVRLSLAGPADPLLPPLDPLLCAAAEQLAAYFAGRLTSFSLPLAPAGTTFQRAVWSAIRSIPCGGTRTYSEIAGSVGHPRAARAVGSACGKNPIPILIPCHRVVGARSPYHYALGPDRKRFLLGLEAEIHQQEKEKETIP